MLDFNCGFGTGQAKTQSDKLRFKQQYSKVTQSWVVKQIPEPKDRVYIQTFNERSNVHSEFQ